mmetsp:Transcript_6911/g.21231  ORF Transcript_6911/g.21231 Transcript_6911/m.21231 type:complete len:84 (-) Transcript_6911:728-979(-)
MYLSTLLLPTCTSTLLLPTRTSTLLPARFFMLHACVLFRAAAACMILHDTTAFVHLRTAACTPLQAAACLRLCAAVYTLPKDS